MTSQVWSVKKLAERWDCSPRHVYNLIDAGKLRAFSIGERSLRITDEERARWEGTHVTSTVEEMCDSDGEAERRSQNIAMRAVSAIARG